MCNLQEVEAKAALRRITDPDAPERLLGLLAAVAPLPRFKKPERDPTTELRRCNST